MSNIGREPSQQMTMFLAMTAARQLSLLINLLGLVHQIAFLAIMSIARLASRTKLLDLVWEGAWIVFVLLMLLACASIAVTMVLTSLAGVSAPIDWLLQIGAWITKNLDSLTNIDGSVVFLTLIGTGLVVVAIIFSMLIIGIVRIGIFTVIGVMDQIRNPFLMRYWEPSPFPSSPQGQSETLVLPGRALFNHVKIYDDERTIDRIAQFIRETVLKVPVDA